MKRLPRWSLLILFGILNGSDAFAQSCTAPPDGDRFHIARRACDRAAPCFPGQTLTFTLQKNVSCYPGVPCSGYSIQPCDTIEWTFDDGATATSTGEPSITHSFATPGMYVVKARVTNRRGTAEVTSATVIAANPPSYVAFERDVYTVSEAAGSVTTTLIRTGDTSRTASIAYRTGYRIGTFERGLEMVEGTVTFAPGETARTITVRVAHDPTYQGDQQHYIWLECYSGSVLLDETVFGATIIRVVEADVAPTATSASSVRVTEGDHGSTLLTIPVTLSRSWDEPVHFWWNLWDGTAKNGTDWLPPETYTFGTLVISPGETTGSFSVRIEGDATKERDEQFVLEFVRSSGPAMVIVGSPVRITIVDDDGADAAEPLTPSFAKQSVEMHEGDALSLLLEVSPYPADGVKATLESSDYEVIDFPSSVQLSAQGRATVDVRGLAAGDAVLTATLPAATGGRSAKISIHVIDLPPPRLERVEPSSGPAGGGTMVTLVGTGLRSDCSVSLGESVASMVSSDGPSIVVETSAGTPGPVDVSVRCGDDVTTLGDGFRYTVVRRRAAGN